MFREQRSQVRLRVARREGVTADVAVMAVMDGKGPCFLARRFVLEDSLGESLATATPVGAAFPVGGVVYPL